MIRAGQLDRLITIEAPGGSADDYGETSPNTAANWTTVVANLPAQKVPLRGAEAIEARTRVGTETGKFIVRWRSDVTVKCRIVFETKNWNIVSVTEVGRREGLELTAVTRI